MVYNELGVKHTEVAQADWVQVSTKPDHVGLNEMPLKEGLVPNVKGMGLQDAIYLLENLGLQVEVKGYGTVKEQSIPPGSRLKNQQKISLRLS